MPDLRDPTVRDAERPLRDDVDGRRHPGGSPTIGVRCPASLTGPAEAGQRGIGRVICRCGPPCLSDRGAVPLNTKTWPPKSSDVEDLSPEMGQSMTNAAVPSRTARKTRGLLFIQCLRERRASCGLPTWICGPRRSVDRFTLTSVPIAVTRRAAGSNGDTPMMSLRAATGTQHTRFWRVPAGKTGHPRLQGHIQQRPFRTPNTRPGEITSTALYDRDAGRGGRPATSSQ